MAGWWQWLHARAERGATQLEYLVMVLLLVAAVVAVAALVWMRAT